MLRKNGLRVRIFRQTAIVISVFFVGIQLFLVHYYYKSDDDHRQSSSRPQMLPPTLFLGRLIGNALPPRHSVNQTLDNLQFILQHEKKHPQVIRHWFLNRIVDPNVERQVIRLLQHNNESFTIFPFDLQKYAKIGYHFERQENFSAIPVTWEGVNHEKNVYTIGINSARNRMLAYGQRQTPATFLLPWDGNCFLTPKALQTLLQQLFRYPRDNYFFVPMDRVRANTDVLNPHYQPDASEEPQVIFRRNAVARFNPYLRYPLNDKVELLKRLRRIHLPWDTPWDWRFASKQKMMKIPDHVRGADQVVNLGWVARLSSGHVDTSARQRSQHRDAGLHRLFVKLDHRVNQRRIQWNTTFGFVPPLYDKLGSHLSGLDLIQSPNKNISANTWPVRSQATVRKLAGGFQNVARSGDKATLAPFTDEAIRVLGHWMQQQPEFGRYFDNNDDWPAMMQGITDLLESIKVLNMPESFVEQFRDWIAYRGWGEEFATAKDYRGIWFDLHFVAIAVFRNNLGLPTSLLFRAMERMDRIIDPSKDGQLTCQTEDSLFSFITLARMVQTILGHDLWKMDYTSIRNGWFEESSSSTKLCLVLQKSMFDPSCTPTSSLKLESFARSKCRNLFGKGLSDTASETYR